MFSRYNKIMNNDDTIFFSHENLVIVLSAFFKEFKGNPLDYVSMDEAVTKFSDEYSLNDDGEYEMTEKSINEFMYSICGMYVDRLMVDMDKKGLATLAHDGNEFFLIKKKD